MALKRHKARRELKIPLKNLLDEKVYEKVKNETNPLIQKETLENLNKNLKSLKN